MTDRIPATPLDRDQGESLDHPAEPRGWTPIVLDEERGRRSRLADELRPLLDSLDRLRERGLLD